MKPTTLKPRLLLLAAMEFSLLCTPAPAAFVFSLQQPINANSGSTGNAFDVLVTNTGASAVTIGGFFFGVTTTDASITFTSANTVTVVDPYIFAGDSFDVNNSVPLNTTSGQSLDAADLSDSGAGTSVAPGATFGVGHILFDIANGAAAGPASVTFDSTFTSLADAGGNPVAFTTSPGTINVSTPNTVPEPATFALVFCGLAGLAVLARRS